MNLFFEYIKQHLKAILLFSLFSIIFAIVFYLYSLPIESVGYAVLICSFFGIIALSYDYICYVNKHKKLQLLVKEITVTTDTIPSPHGIIENDYQQVLKTLFETKTQLECDLSQRYSDLVEYYTVWVHQIKTPIAAMRLILQSNDTPENRELGDELQKIEQYVEMVLGYLRLESESTDYVIKEYSLDSIIRQAIHKYASLFIRKKIRLEFEPTEFKVISDEKWLLFVITQILSNSLKYTKSGTVCIRLEKPSTLVISDTGIGISASDLPRVFENGFTGYNGRGDKKATGIGLYLCKRILSKLGHGISIESTVGMGTTVRIVFPSKKIRIE